MPKIEFNCANCGKLVQSYDSQSSKYCSQACFVEARTKIRYSKQCPICDKQFDGPLVQIYCSRTCKSKRDHASERGNYKVVCPDCGLERYVMRRPKRQTLCSKCAAQVIKNKRPHTSGSTSPSWKGGRRIDSYGYVKLNIPGHPFADSTKYVREHLVVATEAYGEKYIRENGGCVHHINGDKQDNRLKNLWVCTAEQNIKYNHQLLAIAFELVRTGVIEFDRGSGQYSCPLLSNETGASLKFGEP
jgi:hypothetical protein